MSKRILLVDDQEIERTALRMILQRESQWVLSEASDGQVALDLLCSQVRPQLCLVDVRMPNVDGLEFLQRIRRDPDLRDLKVMITSGTRDRNTIIELAKLGIEGYVLKPFDPEKTFSAVHAVMAKVPDPDEASGPVRDLLTKVAVVADDDEVARTAMAQLIKSEKHWTVVETPDGATTLDLLRRGPLPDYLFLDLQMPGLDGHEVLHQIRENDDWKSLRIAVSSAERDREKVRSLAKMRIEAYLLKPVDPTKVKAALRAVP